MSTLSTRLGDLITTLAYIYSIQGRYKYRSGMFKNEKTFRDITGNVLETANGLPVTSLDVLRQYLEVSHVLTLVAFLAWARHTYVYL
jgi:hypothetical protein